MGISTEDKKRWTELWNGYLHIASSSPDTLSNISIEQALENDLGPSSLEQS